MVKGPAALTLDRLVSSLPDANGAARPVAHQKVSMTLEAPALAAVRAVTDNVSAFYNEAGKKELYFRRLDAEADRLEAAGVTLDESGREWLHRQLSTKPRRR